MGQLGLISNNVRKELSVIWIDNDFPKLLGAELYRPHPAYIIEMAVEPVVVHDFSKQPGQTVQLDRYRFWGKPGTKESRERTADQTLGTASARNIVKDKVLVTFSRVLCLLDVTLIKGVNCWKTATIG